MPGNLNVIQVGDHFEVSGGNFDVTMCLDLEDYRDKVIIQGCSFNEGLFIKQSRFHAGLEIRNTTILGTFWFWCCEVTGAFLCHGLHVRNSKTGTNGQTYDGEANFCLSRFKGPVSFFALDISGPSYWVHTKFLDDFLWNGCELRGNAAFENLDGFVAARKMEIELQEDIQHAPKMPGLFRFLTSKGFLKRDSESQTNVAYGLIGQGKTGEVVRGWSLPEDVTSHLVTLLENNSQPMFAVGKKVEFANLTIGSPAPGNNNANRQNEVHASFKRVDFSPCWRFNANFERIRFEDCIWKEVKSKPLTSTRPQLAGEEAMIETGTREIITTYKMLSAAYKRQGEWENASSWRYSAREVERRMADNMVARILRFLDCWVLGSREFAGIPLLWCCLLFSGLVIMAIGYGDNVWPWRAVQSLVSGKGIPTIEASNLVTTLSMVVGSMVMLLLPIAGGNFVNRHGWFVRKSPQSEK